MIENEFFTDDVITIDETGDANLQEIKQDVEFKGIEPSADAVSTAESATEIEMQETVQTLEVEDVKLFTVDMGEVLVELGEIDDQLNHALLHNTHLPDQHPITAITGLDQKLKQIEALQTVYSDKKQQADYYKWRQDTEHSLPANPYGLFVSILDGTDKIEICDGTRDVFGVTVADAAFVGNQEYVQAEGGTKTGRDGSYCLVVYSGLASVRSMPSVVVGDYVTPNSRGEATKSDGDYGYLVTALSKAGDDLYAIISLNTPTTLSKVIADNMQDLGKRMTTAEYNLTSVTNVANSAYALAMDAKENAEVNSEYLEEKITEVLGKMDAVDGIVGNLSESVTNACETAALAKAVSESAVSSANAMMTEAVGKANEANSNVNDLIYKYAPLEEWVDPTTGRVGASYVINYMNSNGLATKAEVETVDDKTKENYTAIQQNAESIQSLASKIDKYAIGEYSQAYGLTLEQAISILKVGYIYVPTLVHTESYSDYKQEFSLGYYYEWNGESWTPSQSTAVSFSGEYFVGTELTPYWSVTIDDVVKDDVTYYLGGLYHWENGAWVKVASAADNTLSRAVSAIKQTANSIELDVVSVKEDVADVKVVVDGTKAEVQSLASWAGQDGKRNLATIQQTADDGGARMALVVVKDAEDSEDIELGGASIVLNDGDKGSYIQMSADNIDFTAENYQIHADKIQFDGSKFSVEMQEQITLSVNNIEIGGRNLLRNSSFSGMDNIGAEVVFKSDENMITFDVDALGIDENGNVKLREVYLWLSDYAVKNMRNSYVTLQGEYKVNSDLTYGEANPWVGYQMSINSDETPNGRDQWMDWFGYTNMPSDAKQEWTKFCKTYKVVDKSISDVFVVVLFRDVKGSVSFKNLKIEFGNKATDWTPAPEDVDEQIKASITVTSEKIEMLAENIEAKGYVTFTNLETEGETTIHGGNIKTESLSAISANMGEIISGCIHSRDYGPTPNFNPYPITVDVTCNNFTYQSHITTGGFVYGCEVSVSYSDVFWEDTPTVVFESYSSSLPDIDVVCNQIDVTLSDDKSQITISAPVFVTLNNDINVDSLNSGNIKVSFKLSGKHYTDYIYTGAIISFEDSNKPFIRFPKFQVDADGSIKATSGLIAGYEIEDDMICCINGDKSVYMSGADSKHFAFAAGADDPDGAPFCVSKQGQLRATNGAEFGGCRTPRRIYFDGSSGGLWNGLEILDSARDNIVVFTAQGVGIRDAKDARNEAWNSDSDDGEIYYDTWCTWKDIINVVNNLKQNP